MDLGVKFSLEAYLLVISREWNTKWTSTWMTAKWKLGSMETANV